MGTAESRDSLRTRTLRSPCVTRGTSRLRNEVADIAIPGGLVVDLESVQFVVGKHLCGRVPRQAHLPISESVRPYALACRHLANAHIGIRATMIGHSAVCSRARLVEPSSIPVKPPRP
jgi:hypothetical protein